MRRGTSVSASRNAISGADVATGKLVESLLSDVVKGTNAFDVPGAQIFMLRKIRNLGRPIVPVVIQHTRLDSRQAQNALMTTIAFPG